MFADIQPPTVTVTARTGVEIAKALGVGLDEGVIVALLPDVIDEVTTQEVPIIDSKGERMHAIYFDCGSWGRRLVDIVGSDKKPVKWWRVKEAAKQEGKDLIPIRWHGPIGEIPERYLDRGVTAIRFYQHGPFFFPMEQPKVKPNEMAEAVEAVIGEAVAPAG